MKNFCFLHVFTIALPLLLIQNCNGLAKFTNIKCQNVDMNFSKFTLCRLRAIKRDVTELSLKVELLHLPILAPTMRWQLLKKASGYRPFLYDVTVDVCDYLEKHNNPFVNIIMHSFANYSSVMQKCPISVGELFLLNFRFPEKSLNNFLPLPTGEYALFGTFSAHAVERAVVNVYFMLDEDPANPVTVTNLIV